MTALRFFADKEELRLQKILDAGVIQPSMSNWAKLPVLIRRKDRQVHVHWCLNYRHLKKMMWKDMVLISLIALLAKEEVHSLSKSCLIAKLKYPQDHLICYLEELSH